MEQFLTHFQNLILTDRRLRSKSGPVFLISKITIEIAFFEIVKFQVVFFKILTLTNQNQKVFYLFEVLTPLHGTFFSVQ